MNNRRKHFKINTYPSELQEAINKKITEGHTYHQIADWLGNMGHAISHTAVANYSKEFLSKLERIRIVKEQAKVIVTETGDGPATHMAEAASTLAMQLVMEVLNDADKGKLEKEKITDVLKAMAQLERSAVARESLKLQYQKKVDVAFKKLREEIWQELGTNPELYDKVIAYVNRVEQRMVEEVE